MLSIFRQLFAGTEILLFTHGANTGCIIRIPAAGGKSIIYLLQKMKDCIDAADILCYNCNKHDSDNGIPRYISCIHKTSKG